MSGDIALSTKGLTKEFKGFVAVHDVNLAVQRNTIHALIGPNGAGKTTLMNLLTGFLRPTRGQIFYEGEQIAGRSPAANARKGLARSFQISATFPHLTVRENVRIALQRKLGNSFQFWRSERALSVLDPRVDELLADVGLLDAAGHNAAELPYGRKRAMELATTLALEPKLILLDEPTAGLGREDVARICDLIRSAARRRTVVMVEHNMDVVADLSERITVLERGEILVEGTYAEVSADPRVLEAYVGGGYA